MAVHDNHRVRVKEKFLKTGLDGMHDHEVLELLLFYAIPRIDVNPIAHRLMDRFQTLHAVFEAPIIELQKVDGIGENSATLIHLMMELYRRYGIDRKNNTMLDGCLKSTAQIGAFMAPHFLGLRYEAVMLACVDNKGLVLSCEEIARGTIDETNISIRQVIAIALAKSAHGVILAHNHPGGIALPSMADFNLTKRLKSALDVVGIAFLDHIVVADIADVAEVAQDDYISMRDNGSIV